MPTEVDKDKPSHVTFFRSSLLSPCVSPERPSADFPAALVTRPRATAEQASDGDNPELGSRNISTPN